MSRIKLILLALVAAGLSIGFAACGDSDDSTSSGGSTSLDLTIGDLIPLTGDLSDFGPPGDKAAQIAVDQINQAASDAGADHTVTLSPDRQPSAHGTPERSQAI